MPWSQSSLHVWRFLDGRPGHENQTIGLSDAIARQVECEFVDIHVPRDERGIRFLLSHEFRRLRVFRGPDVLIGAGHATHVPMLMARLRHGGLATVIMKPTIPMIFFDLCLVPVHDEAGGGKKNVVPIEGALNRMRPASQRDARKGVILIGGPSRHFGWNDQTVLQQVAQICERSFLDWTIVTSDRTPPDFLKQCRRLMSGCRSVSIVEPFQNGRSWLPALLSTASTVWATCDSMSMIYESLTCGASLGLIELKALRDGRIVRNIQRLAVLGFVTRWSDWIEGSPLPRGGRPLCEADRCASVILDRLRTKELLDSQNGWRTDRTDLVVEPHHATASSLSNTA